MSIGTSQRLFFKTKSIGMNSEASQLDYVILPMIPSFTGRTISNEGEMRVGESSKEKPSAESLFHLFALAEADTPSPKERALDRHHVDIRR